MLFRRLKYLKNNSRVSNEKRTTFRILYILKQLRTLKTKRRKHLQQLTNYKTLIFETFTV